MLTRWCSAFFLLPLVAAQLLPAEKKLDRVIAAGKLWAIIKEFHPALAYRDIDWDQAWLLAYPGLKGAKDRQEFANQIRAMLDVLGDPLTTVNQPTQLSQSSGGDVVTTWSRGILTVTIPDSYDFVRIKESLRRLSENVSQAKAIIFDLRKVSEGAVWVFPNALDASGLSGKLTATPLVAPARRKTLHTGYYSGFVVRNGTSIAPGPGATQIPVIFVVHDRAALPWLAPALQVAGSGRIVSEGPLTDWSLVDSLPVTLCDDLKVSVRTSELLYADGTTGLAADAVVNPGEGLKVAVQMATNVKVFPTAVRMRVPFTAIPRREGGYADSSYPSAPYRTLAALRIWSNYRFYSPHRDLSQEDWDNVLEHFFPLFEAARDPREYHLAVAEMVSHFHDSHATVQSSVLTDTLGAATPQIRVRWIEKTAVVTRVDESGRNAGIHNGDGILTVDGEDVRTRLDMLSRYISASTQAALMRDVCDQLLAGPVGSKFQVKLRRPNGGLYETVLTRTVDPHWYYKTGERGGDIVRLLPGNIGYVDLDRLTQSLTGEMFARLQTARAIIFDMRGYPSETELLIAPWLSGAKSPVAAILRQPMSISPEQGGLDNETTMATTLQHIPVLGPSRPRFAGKTVMLIDEEAQSEAEHTGLWFEAANGTKFVGSPTAGADGPVTEFTVPGGIRVHMTGMDVRHADGRVLQRAGVQPDIEVRPSIAGIAGERDEVLDRAIAYLLNGK
jgi:C-terminal processing protease CtpA/Prc